MTMTDEQKRKVSAAKREYHRKWREKNKDRIQRYNAEYWLRKAEQLKNQEAKTT